MKGRRIENREGLILQLSGESGATGLGEASPLPGFSRETIEETASQLSRLASFLVGRNLEQEALGFEDAGSVPGSPGLSASAKFGLETAVCNLYSEVESKSLAEVFGGPIVGSVPTSGLLDGSREEIVGEARRMREAGYGAVKMKVGRRGVGEDAGLVCELRGVLGGGIPLRLDANRAWGFEEAVDFVRAVSGVGYEYLEEPLADSSGLRRLAEEYGVPVALDESLVGMLPGELAGQDHVRAVVIKPTIVGGVARTLRLAREAESLGITPVISSAYETGIGTQALLNLSAATGGGKVAAGLDTYRRLETDVLNPPLDMEKPRVDLHETNSLRRELQDEFLAVVERWGVE